ncbi:hypothetical protein Tco_0366841 [Tanacetum coccineum]
MNLYNNFKIVEQEVKGTENQNSSSSSQNMAFVSTPSSTNKVNIAYGVSTANTQVSTTSAQVSIANLSDATVYAFLIYKFLGYSMNSKALKVYDIRTRKVEENLHIRFLEDKPIIVSDGPKWLFDIDVLTKSMNYVPVVAGTNSNDLVGTEESIGAGHSSKETGSSQAYILMPLWKDGSLFDSSLKNTSNDEHLNI